MGAGATVWGRSGRTNDVCETHLKLQVIVRERADVVFNNASFEDVFAELVLLAAFDEHTDNRHQ